MAVIRMGVRIFQNGRNPKDGSSLALTRRLARQMRRRRDRLLKRKGRLLDALVSLGFWPEDLNDRRSLSALDPYVLRRKGLDEPLTPSEFGRAVFHLNQRRGFQSNRRTDRKDNERGLMNAAIQKLRAQLASDGARTVGEWLAGRHAQRQGVRARLRGTSAKDRAYDLYIDRSMIRDEFDRLWHAQHRLDPDFYTADRRRVLEDVIFFQRPLKPVQPGPCTLLPHQPRALLALPSVQRFRIYQELNHLRIVSPTLEETPLTRAQRDALAAHLERADLTFVGARRLLELSGRHRFNLEDSKRDRLKGNASGMRLAKADLLGDRWASLSEADQDEIVRRLMTETSAEVLINWLADRHGIERERATLLCDVQLPEGYGRLGEEATQRVLAQLREDVVSYADAVVAAGFDSHSVLGYGETTGHVMERLPYYGEVLQRHVGFPAVNAKPDDPPERRFGRIANPTVHIGLNELRKVLNDLLDRYGHPAEIVVEVARELKQGYAQRMEEQKRQAERQKQNDFFREQIRGLFGSADRHVSAADVERMRLWHELNPTDAADRRCPYTGEVIGMARLFSADVEVEHILPFARTLDDSLNNKTVALRRANRVKGNLTPYEAFGHSPDGYDYAAILERATRMPREKAKRFAADGYARWLRQDKDFLGRALTDTAYLSRLAREYLSVICPFNRVRVIAGRLTALLRGKFGLNTVLGVENRKNRDDHRHHAVDAAVVAVTDPGLLQRVASASAQARERQLGPLVDEMPLPWSTFRAQVARAAAHIVVSHRPDHGHEGALHNDTAYGLRPGGEVVHRIALSGLRSEADLGRLRMVDSLLQEDLRRRLVGLSGREFAAQVAAIERERGIRRVRIVEKLSVIPVCAPGAWHRHGADDEGQNSAYKGYKGDSNYGIEIWRDEKGRWRSTVITTFEAHRIVRENGGGAAGLRRLRHPALAQGGQPLVMRLVNGDMLRMTCDGRVMTLQVCKIDCSGAIHVAGHNEANIRARKDAGDPTLLYLKSSASAFQKGGARRITVSPAGFVNDGVRA